MEDDRGELERRLKHLGNALTLGIVASYGERDEARRMLFEVADTIGAARRAIRGTIAHCDSCGGTGYSGVMLSDEPAEGESPLVKLTCPRCMFLRKALAKLEGGD